MHLLIELRQGRKIKNVLESIRNKKQQSEKKLGELKEKNINDNIKYYNTNMIGVNLVNGCNLSCSYCYISASSKKRKELSDDIFIDILNFLKKEKNNPITFYFTGSGEPTLNFKLIRKLATHCKVNGFKKVSFDLTTNGTILTQEMLVYFKEHKIDITISFDGPEAIQNSNRIFRNGKGSFSQVYNNVKLLKESNIDFLCSTVLLPNNKKILDVFSFFEENKLYFIFTIATNSFDNHFMPKIEDLDNFEYQMDLVVNKYVELIKSNNTIFCQKIKNDIRRIHYGDTKDVACVGGREGIYVDIDGNIYTCSYHSSAKELSIGDIYTGINYDKIIENKWYAQPVDNYETCRDCWMKYLCSGSCFAIKWLENNNTEIPSKYLCKTYDIYWRAIIKLYILIYPDIIEGKNVNFKDINDGK